MPTPPQSNTSNIFTLQELFAIPIEAVIDANVHAAEAAVRFIKKYGFEPPAPDAPPPHPADLGRLRMARFTYDYQDDRGEMRTTVISIPFLSLIPLPLLEVKKATFHYAIQILGFVAPTAPVANEEPDAKTIVAIMAPMQTPPPEALSSLKANMTVDVEVGQADLPAGILQLLNIGQEATKGRMGYPFVLETEPVRRMYFRPDAYTQSIRVNVRTQSGQPAGAELLVRIIRCTDALTDMFANPIVVAQGDPVGIPGWDSANALTDDNGVAVFSFTARHPQDAWPNGQIVIEMQGAAPVYIYFRIENQTI